MLLAFLLFFSLHAAVWFSTNYQLAENVSQKSALILCVLLAIPTSLMSFYATREAHNFLGSAWGVKLLGFGVGYFVFPILTWIILKESPFNIKTMSCIVLSFAIVAIQVFVPDS